MFLYADLDLGGEAMNLIGGGCGTDNIFTGIFDGDGHRVFNYTFADSDYLGYNSTTLFLCSNERCQK